MAVETYRADELESLAIGAVRAHAVRRLETELRVPARAKDDWSIPAPRDCPCALCADLARFLADRSRTRHEWPLAQDKRRHVHGAIDEHELPVTHKTRRSGRPFTLVLQKTRTLFEREAAERAAREEALLQEQERTRVALDRVRTTGSPGS